MRIMREKLRNSKISSTYVLLFCDSPDVLAMAAVLGDFGAPDCRFINMKRGQGLYVYFKLLPVDGAGVFWSGNVCAKFLKTLTHFST